MGTTISSNEQSIKRDWYVVDATDIVLGRLATQLAHRLRGKHKPEFTTHVDTGDYIVVKNAAKIRWTGNKADSKLYYRHSLHTGSLKTTTLGELMAKDPTEVLQRAVKGMLSKGPLGRAMLKKLKVYVGDAHPHEAQQPKALIL